MNYQKGKYSELLLFLFPALLIYTVFMFIPLIASLPVSLFNWSGIGEKSFVGLANYQKLFTMSPFNIRFLNALKNNALWYGITMVIQNLLALIFALILSKNVYFKRFFRTVLFMPTTLSVIIVGYVFVLIMNPQWGFISELGKILGIKSIVGFPWLGNESTALISVAIVNSWQYIGIPMMLFLAGIQGISEDLVEASKIDGCSGWKTFSKITLPLLSPVIGMVMVLTFVGDFSGFDLVYAMEGTMAGPNYATDLLGTFFYRVSFGSYGGATQDLGLGSAIATCMFFIIGAGVVLWLIYDRKVQRNLK